MRARWPRPHRRGARTTRRPSPSPTIGNCRFRTGSSWDVVGRHRRSRRSGARSPPASTPPPPRGDGWRPSVSRIAGSGSGSSGSSSVVHRAAPLALGRPACHSSGRRRARRPPHARRRSATSVPRCAAGWSGPKLRSKCFSVEPRPRATWPDGRSRRAAPRRRRHGPRARRAGRARPARRPRASEPLRPAQSERGRPDQRHDPRSTSWGTSRAPRAPLAPATRNSHPLLLSLVFSYPETRRTGSSVTVSRRHCYPVYEVMEIERSCARTFSRSPTGCSGRSWTPRTSSRRRFSVITSSDADVESPKAYLATVTTRLAIDELRSPASRREVYPGEWLPEPLVEDEAVRRAETADSLSMTFLHLLEKLSPVERAVFLLREVFDYDYEEVSRIVGKTPANARQILARAHAHIPGWKAPLRGVAGGAGRGRAALPRGLGGGGHPRARGVARPRCDHLRGRRWQRAAFTVPLVGAEPVAKALIGWGREGAESAASPTGRRASTASRASSSTTPGDARAGSQRSRSPTAWSSPCGRC